MDSSRPVRPLDRVLSGRAWRETQWGITLYPITGEFRLIRSNIPSYAQAVKDRDASMRTGRFYKAWIWEQS